MVHYFHVSGRHHGITSSQMDDHIRHLEDTIKLALPEGSQWHGMYYHQGRKRVHPSWFRKEIIFAFAGHKGLKRLDEIWYHTWIFVLNLKTEGNLKEGFIRTLLALEEMTVEKVEGTDGRGLDAATKRMLHLRNKIPWLNDRQARKENWNGCWYFGKWFEIGRHI